MTSNLGKAKHIKAAGGVVYELRETDVFVLLIFRNGYWDIPKGKLEKGEDLGHRIRQNFVNVHRQRLQHL